MWLTPPCYEDIFHVPFINVHLKILNLTSVFKKKQKQNQTFKKCVLFPNSVIFFVMIDKMTLNVNYSFIFIINAHHMA